MGMVTELDLLPQVVVGGEKIQVHKWTLNNEHLHQYLHTLANLQLGMIEADSGNVTSFVTQQDSEMVQAAWKQSQFEWATAKKWRGLEAAAMEKTYAVLAVTSNEALRVQNVKVRRVVQALATLIHKVAYCDSAKAQYGISDRDVRTIESQQAYVQEIILAYLGDGTARQDGGANTGMEVPQYAHVGTVKPPLNLWQAVTAEPSPAAPDVPAPDFPDTPSTVPAPNSQTVPGQQR